MTESFKGIIIITNHFKEQPVDPKIVYINKNLLSVLGYTLEDIINLNPEKIFKNWTGDQFIQEIVSCVEQKISWAGNLDVKQKNGKIFKNKFIITPVYTISGDVSYYSCSTEIAQLEEIHELPEKDICLDDFISCLWEYQEHFREVCDMAPVNLLKINKIGKIKYLNNQAVEHFGFKVGDNLFDMISQNSSKTKITKFFTDKQTIGKVSKVGFDINYNNKQLNLNCKFWPLADDSKEIKGYSINLSDVSKAKEIVKEFMALKGS